MSSINTSVSSIVSKKKPKTKKPPYRVLPNTKITPEPHSKDDEVSSSASISTIGTIISELDTSPPSLFEESYSISVSEFPATSTVSEVGAPGDIDEFLIGIPPKAPDRQKYKMWIIILVTCGLFVIVLSVSSLAWFFITRPDLKEERSATTTSIPSDFLFPKVPSIVAIDDDNQGRSLKDVQGGGGNENTNGAGANGRSLQIVSDNQNQKAPHQGFRNSYESFENFSNPRHQRFRRPVTERIAEVHDDVKPRPKKSQESTRLIDEPVSKPMAPASNILNDHPKQEDRIFKSFLEDTDDLSNSREDRDNPQYSDKVIMVESSEKPSLKALPSYYAKLAPSDSDIQTTSSIPVVKYIFYDPLPSNVDPLPSNVDPLPVNVDPLPANVDPLPVKATRERPIKSRPEKKRRKRLNPDCPPDCIPGEWCRVRGIGQWMKC